MTGVSLPEMETNNHDALKDIAKNLAVIAHRLRFSDTSPDQYDRSAGTFYEEPGPEMPERLLALQAISKNTARIANTLEWIAWAAGGLLVVFASYYARGN